VPQRVQRLVPPQHSYREDLVHETVTQSTSDGSQLTAEGKSCLPDRINLKEQWKIFHENFADLKGYTVAKRSVFILDQNGRLQYKWISEDPAQEPNYREIIGQLGQLWVK
jgi:peroxiredoxin